VTLLIELLGGLDHALNIAQSREFIKLPLPFCKIRINPKTSGKKWLYRIKLGTLQYVVIRPVTTIIAIILQIAGVYCSGNILPIYGWFYITVIVFGSVTTAMYCLVAFYATMKADLQPFKPLLKFLAIKFVIFFSFWQLVVVAGLVKIGVVKATTYWTADNVATGIQNMLIDIEMVLASILHLYCFSHKEYLSDKPEENKKTSVWTSFLAVMNLIDVVKEGHRHMVPKVIRRELPFFQEQEDEENAKELEDHVALSGDEKGKKSDEVKSVEIQVENDTENEKQKETEKEKEKEIEKANGESSESEENK